MAHISDIKLIRTDTTLDLSQKAEKGMSLPLDSPPLIYVLRSRGEEKIALVGLTKRFIEFSWEANRKGIVSLLKGLGFTVYYAKRMGSRNKDGPKCSIALI
jgi:hypothetical protein